MICLLFVLVSLVGPGFLLFVLVLLVDPSWCTLCVGVIGRF